MTNYFDDIVIPLLICISKFLQLESCFQIEDENVNPEKTNNTSYQSESNKYENLRITIPTDSPLISPCTPVTAKDFTAKDLKEKNFAPIDFTLNDNLDEIDKKKENSESSNSSNRSSPLVIEMSDVDIN